MVFWCSNSNRRVQPARRRNYLQCEEMEERCVPARYLWSPLAPDTVGTDFGTPSNWSLRVGDASWIPSGSIPGTNDDIEFQSNVMLGNILRNTNVRLTIPTARTVHSVKIDASYTETITLQANLTVSGVRLTDPSPGQQTSSQVVMRSATIAGGNRSQGEGDG